MNFEDVLVQVFQPYFYYSVIALAISFVCIKIVVKCCPFMGSKAKSLIYLIPIVAPLFVMLSFPPKTAIQAVSSRLIGSFSIPAPQAPALFGPFHLMQPPLSQTSHACGAFNKSDFFNDRNPLLNRLSDRRNLRCHNYSDG